MIYHRFVQRLNPFSPSAFFYTKYSHRILCLSGLISICLPLIFLCGCSKDEPAETGPIAYPVESQSIEASPVEDSSVYVAKMDSRKTVALHSRVDGHIVRILKQPEDYAREGELIVEIDPLKEKQNVESKFADYQSAEAEYHSQLRKLKALEAQRSGTNAKVEFAEKEFGRYTRLLAKGAVSKQLQESKERSLKVQKADADSLEAQIEAQKAAVNSASKQMARSQSDVNAQKEQLSYHEIKAPFGGTVGNIPVKIGDYITPQTGITSISQSKPLEVYIQIPKDEAGKVRHGTTVELLDSSDTKIGDSKVFYISPVVDKDTQSVLVKSLFENNANELRPAQNVTARVIWGRSQGIVIPTKALAMVGGQPFIYVLEKGEKGATIARQKPVELGPLQGNNGILIEKGLNSGEKLVVSGIQNLSDGASVVEKSKS